MDPNDVTRLVAELRLTGAAEKAVVQFPTPANTRPERRRLAHVLVGKIFDSRVVNRDTLRTHIPRILQVRGDVETEIAGDNLFIVSFGMEGDRRRALLDGPWHFFRSLMLFKEPIGLQNPANIQFDEYKIWIQCHNLPVACMTPAMVKCVGEQVGKVLEVDVTEGGSCFGQFARVRVSRLITEPLQRCVKIVQEEGHEEQIVLIRYERLPEFCTTCGRVGHPVRHCPDESADKEVQAFGVWLRAGRVADARRPRNMNPGNTRSESQREGSGRFSGSQSAPGLDRAMDLEGPELDREQPANSAGVVEARMRGAMKLLPMHGEGAADSTDHTETSREGHKWTADEEGDPTQDNSGLEVGGAEAVMVPNPMEEERPKLVGLMESFERQETSLRVEGTVETRGAATENIIGGSTRRWKRRARVLKESGGGGEPMMAGATKRKGEQEVESVVKVARFEFRDAGTGRNIASEELITAAAAEHNDLPGLECTGFGERSYIPGSPSANS